jgi:hypothetical protein
VHAKGTLGRAAAASGRGSQGVARPHHTAVPDQRLQRPSLPVVVVGHGPFPGVVVVQWRRAQLGQAVELCGGMVSCGDTAGQQHAGHSTTASPQTTRLRVDAHTLQRMTWVRRLDAAK